MRNFQNSRRSINPVVMGKAVGSGITSVPVKEKPSCVAKTRAEDKFAEQFVNLMIQKIESLQTNWKQPWFNTKIFGFPQSITGRLYNGMNSFMLYLYTESMNFKTPVFITFKQAKNMGANVNKGEKSFPVVFWDFTIRNIKTNVRITLDEYKKLTNEEKEQYTVRPFLVYHNVFNIDQTNLEEVNPELFHQVQEKFVNNMVIDDNGLYSNPAIDEMIQQNGWLCKIIVKESNQAFYRRNTDEITVPLKGQFDTGEDFYSTLLHEMTHSTGSESRLNRTKGKKFGDEDYAQEELVAELTSAMICHSIGINNSIQEQNAAYLKSWLKSIHQSPNFLLSILGDVNKASRMIITEIAKYDSSLVTELEEAIAEN